MPDLLAQHLPSLFGPGRRTAWRRRVARRLVAGLALCLGLALALGERSGGATEPVLVASSSVRAGTPVAADAVRVERRRADELPEDALTATSDAVGRISTVAISPGEVLTTQRVLGRGPAAVGRDGRLVTLPLVASPTSVGVGDRVDVYRPGRRQALASGALVVAIPGATDELSPTAEPTVVVSLPGRAAADVVTAIDTDRVTGFVLTTQVRPT